MVHQMDNWDDYRLILELHRCGTLRGAAEQLGITHSTVSRKLVMLQEAADQPLFERVAGGYRATEYGQQFVDAGLQIEAVMRSAKRRQRACGALSGPLTLSMPDALGEHLLFETLAAFWRKHPQIDLRLESSARLVDLDRSEADVVVRAADAPPEHLVGRRVSAYAVCHYASSDYFETTAPEDRRWIVGPYRGTEPKWLASSPFPNTPIACCVGDIRLRHRAAVEGFGMILGPCFMSDPEPRLRRVPRVGAV